MTEWRLWEGDEPPFFTTSEFFAAHPWIEPVHQIGHAERTAMVADVIDDLCEFHLVESFLDLGCGDGSLLRQVREMRPHAKLRGITASLDDAAHAYTNGLDGVEVGDFLSQQLQWEQVTVMTEVLEHLVDPHGFLRQIESEYFVASSPSAETGDWHYEHHAWAWDLDGYMELMSNADWHVIWQRECLSEKSYDHGTGLYQPLRFQVVVCERF